MNNINFNEINKNLKNSFSLKNVKDTLMYYYINPNVNYIKTKSVKYYNDSKDDFAKINFNKIIDKPNEFKIKKGNYNILTPHNISLSTNIKYENKLKIGFIICSFIVFIFFIKYINYFD